MKLLLDTVIFFFKQKTAYEMRISDWSSDVCSSDLQPRRQRLGGGGIRRQNDGLVAERVRRRPRVGNGRHGSQGLGEGVRRLEALRGILGQGLLHHRVQGGRTADIHLGETARLLVQNLVKDRSDEHTSELQSLMRTSFAVFCLK